MRLTGYLRVSTDRQVDEGAGLQTQQATIAEWANARGHTLQWRTDAGESGANGIETRAGLADALDLLDHGAEGIVVYRLDRLARSLVLQEQLLADVKRRGGVVISCSDAENAYLDDAGADPDPTRTMVRQILGAVAEYERGMIRARMVAGQRRKAAAGGYAAGGPPYGWRSDHRGSLIPIPAELAQIEIMVAMHAGGASLRQIAATLTKSGVPARRGKWHPDTIRKIINREHRRIIMTPTHVVPSFGLPYARAGWDAHGPYAECPVCGLRCRADSYRTEDEGTKGPALSYAVHFEQSARVDATDQ